MSHGDKCYTFFIHIGNDAPKNMIYRGLMELSPQSEILLLIYQLGVRGI